MCAWMAQLFQPDGCAFPHNLCGECIYLNGIDHKGQHISNREKRGGGGHGRAATRAPTPHPCLPRPYYTPVFVALCIIRDDGSPSYLSGIGRKGCHYISSFH